MTPLEQTIISNARQELAFVIAYYQEKAGSRGLSKDDEWIEYLCHYQSMNALLALAHQSNSGLSEKAIQALLKIEDQHGAAYRSSMERDARKMVVHN